MKTASEKISHWLNFQDLFLSWINLKAKQCWTRANLNKQCTVNVILTFLGAFYAARSYICSDLLIFYQLFS